MMKNGAGVIPILTLFLVRSAEIGVIRVVGMMYLMQHFKTPAEIESGLKSQ